MDADLPQTPSSSTMEPFFTHGAPEEFMNEDGYLYGGDGDDIDGAYGDGGFGAVPASGVAIAGLPERTVGESEFATEKAECAVCLEGYEAGATLRMMPCSHGFHESCIFGWLRVSRLCPLCRFALPAEEDGEDG